MNILHRAKQNLTGKWISGYYTGSEYFIAENDEGVAIIDIETVGVFINKNCSESGERLFTGDLIILNDGHVYLICFDDFNFRFCLKSSPSSSGMKKMESGNKVGNMFDNPEKFIEPISSYGEVSKTPTSQSFSNRNTKESLRGSGIR